jgi:FkbM family methyltransferase
VFKTFSHILYKILSSINYLFIKILNRNFLYFFKEFFENKSYNSIRVNSKKIHFFTSNNLLKWRFDTFLEKEPETIEWIKSFNNSKEFIFWDIGANVGQYSIYSAVLFKNCKVVAFEPSVNNLRILARNISINKLEKIIKILPLALSNKTNKFLTLNESNFIEGSAHNNFGNNFDSSGKTFQSNFKYTTYGTTINYLLKNKILKIPDYVKIDVDGIEHLILSGAGNFLKHNKIKSLSIEINENFKEQYNFIIKIMKKNNFKILHKKHNSKYHQLSSSKKVYNYIFIKN